MRGALLVAVILLPLASAGMAEAPPIDVQALPASPGPLAFAASHWDGELVHILGGSDRLAPGRQSSPDNFYDTIILFDPSTQTYTRAPQALPGPRSHMGSAEWNGHVYLFGGFRGWEAETPALAQILRYDPATHSVKVMDATLPWEATGVAAASTPDGILLFGGYGCPDGCPVLFYDPATDTITPRKATIPDQRYMMAAAWNGERAVVMGGRPTLHGTYQDNVYAYDPATDTITEVRPLLHATGSGAALQAGHMVLLVGGAAREVEPQDKVHRYHIGLKLPAPSLPLPDAHYAATGVWAGDRGYIFGAGERNTEAFCLCPAVTDTDSIEGVPQRTDTGGAAPKLAVEDATQGGAVGYGSRSTVSPASASDGASPYFDAGSPFIPALAMLLLLCGALARRRP